MREGASALLLGSGGRWRPSLLLGPWLADASLQALPPSSPQLLPCLPSFTFLLKTFVCGFRARSSPRRSHLRFLSEYQLQRPLFQMRSHSQAPGRHFLAEATTRPTTIVEPGFGPGQSGLEVSALSLNPKASLCRGLVLWIFLLLFTKSGSC